MPYTSPATQTAGSVAPASWAAAVKAGLDYLANPPACVLSNSANISVASGAITPVTFNTEQVDTDSMHSTVSNTGRITFNTAGLYTLTGNVQFASNATGFRGLFFYKNGDYTVAGRIASEFRGANNGDVTEISLSRVFKFAVADYVELIAYQTSGVALNVLVAGAFSPTASAVWIGRG
jgi:hypothetical protein